MMLENEPLHIILADDDETDRLIFKEAFEELKIKTIVQTVNNGMQLLSLLSKKDTQLPHLLFLDLNMPRKNGIECLKEIRGNPRFKAISIAIYSTAASEKDMEETFRNGANVYIKKPNDFQVLKQALEKVVRTASQYQYPPFNKENFLLRV
ncbi:MAG TPA: response regulator [Saprospiraceae bacterium]|nr:response regulator [Saprospiraceae bacterium]